MKEGWEYKKLGEVCNITMGQSPDSSTYNKECAGIPFFQGCADFGEIHPRITTYCSAPKKIANTKDILMSVRAPIGTLNIADKRCCIGRGLAALSEKQNISNYKFIFYFLKASQKDLQNKGTGATFKAIGKELIINYSIPVPPLSEQQRIVEELDLLSSIIEKKKAQLKELDSLAQSIFYDMFGDPVINEKGWEVKKLKDICKNYDYMRKPITAKDRIPGAIPYYGASGIVDYVKDYIFDGNYLLVSEDGANLLARTTPIAFGIKGKTWVNNHAHVLCFSNKGLQKFVEFSINSRDISSIVTGCAQPKLTQANLNILPIPLPPLPLQQQFAEKIEAIEQQKELIKQSINEVETLFNSRMDYYFN